MKEAYIIKLIKDYAKMYGKAPTIASFENEYNIKATIIIRKCGPWNNLIKKAGLKPNKCSKRTKEQIINWLKTHPNSKYSQIPSGIRGAAEELFGTLSNARQQAGLNIVDWRGLCRIKNNRENNAGRPIEYPKEIIINGLHILANKLNRPPRMKDICKESCGFNINVVISRFGTFNNALQEACIPPIYSYHERNKLLKRLEFLVMNIKIFLNDIPKYFNIDEVNFVYDNRLEFVRLTRSEIQKEAHKLLKYKNVSVIYLVDDSLYENKKINMFCVYDFIKKINDTILINKIKEIRLKYDEITRKYVGQNFNIIGEL